MCGVAEAIIGGVTAAISVATSVAGAAQQANQQSAANQRAAEDQSDQLSLRNSAANLQRQQQREIETREKFEVDKRLDQTRGQNKAGFAGMQGNFLADVDRTVQLSASDQMSALTVQSMFNDQSTRLTGIANTAAARNAVNSLPRGGSAALTISSSVLQGASQGLNTGIAVKNSNMFG